jgi:uncharacterized protein YkwD
MKILPPTLLSYLTCTLSSVILVACGGGGGGGTSTNPPVITYTATCADNTQRTSTSSLNAAAAMCPIDPVVDAKAAFDYLNAERVKCGFSPLVRNTLIDKAAQSHATWMNTNGNYSHVETAGSAGFTGTSVGSRMSAAGYNLLGSVLSAASYGEVLSYNSNQTSATNLARWLIGAPYHGAYMLGGFGYNAVGLGVNTANGNKALVMNFSWNYDNPKQLIGANTVLTYPCQGVTTASPEAYNESPNPLPATPVSTSWGQPIYIMTQMGNSITIASATMTHVATNKAVPLYPPKTISNDVNAATELLGNWGYVLPQVPLTPNSNYAVTVTGTNNGVNFSKSFTFGTGDANQ